MKKIVAILLTAILVISLAACGNSVSQDSDVSNEDTTPSIESALALMNTVWDSYEDGEKFAAIGGDFSEENNVTDAPGKYSIEDAEALDYSLGVPADSVGMIDDAASLIHMMNANTFTGGVFHVVNTDDVPVFAEALKENIMQRQWLCGFPDKLVVISVGNYVVSAFGNVEVIDNFKTKTMAAYDTAEVIYEEAIA